MVLLHPLTNQSIVENLRLRHSNDIIYTYIGDVLVVVNPYKPIPLYTEDYIKRCMFHAQHSVHFAYLLSSVVILFIMCSSSHCDLCTTFVWASFAHSQSLALFGMT